MTTLGLVDDQAHPYTHGWLACPPHRWAHLLPATQARGITANTVSGSQPTIDRRAALGAQIETMEGAALHYVCNMQGVPYSQVRAISNYVIPRDRSQWQMGLAIKNLNEWILGFVAGLIN
jgi:futalosine hydrolase